MQRSVSNAEQKAQRELRPRSAVRRVHPRARLGAAAAAAVALLVAGCDLGGGEADQGRPATNSTSPGQHASRPGKPEQSSPRGNPTNAQPQESQSGSSPVAPVGGPTCFGLEPTRVGTPGDDTIRGAHGRDVIVSLGGNDHIVGLRGGDRACTGPGDDVVDDAGRQIGLQGGLHAFTKVRIDLGPGDDSVTGGAIDVVLGGTGDDRVIVRHSARIIRLDEGDDTVRISGWEVPLVWPEQGDDTVVVDSRKKEAVSATCVQYTGAKHDMRVDLGSGRVTGNGHDRLVHVRCVQTGPGDDVVYGSSGRDSIETSRGADVIYGRAGGDLVGAGGGPDLVYGGRGGDSVDVGRGDDRAYGGPGNDALTDLFGNDRLYGGVGGDSLVGSYGADHLQGGAGDDFATGGDECDISSHRGPGAVLDSQPNEVFGGSGDDYLIGDRGNDLLDGGPGRDTGQPGWRDGRVDTLRSVEVIHQGCAVDF